VCCHKSYIDGLRHVKRIGKNVLELSSGIKIPVSRGQYSHTNKTFVEYYKNEK
jgi:hypothetical protein